MTTLTTDKEALHTQHQTLQEEHASLQQRLASVQRSLQAAGKNASLLNKDLDASEAQCVKLATSLQELTQQADAYDKHASALVREQQQLQGLAAQAQQLLLQKDVQLHHALAQQELEEKTRLQLQDELAASKTQAQSLSEQLAQTQLTTTKVQRELDDQLALAQARHERHLQLQKDCDRWQRLLGQDEDDKATAGQTQLDELAQYNASLYEQLQQLQQQHERQVTSLHQSLLQAEQKAQRSAVEVERLVEEQRASVRGSSISTTAGRGGAPPLKTSTIRLPSLKP